jgi:hypothetical protein
VQERDRWRGPSAKATAYFLACRHGPFARPRVPRERPAAREAHIFEPREQEQTTAVSRIRVNRGSAVVSSGAI